MWVQGLCVLGAVYMLKCVWAYVWMYIDKCASINKCLDTVYATAATEAHGYCSINDKFTRRLLCFCVEDHLGFLYSYP